MSTVKSNPKGKVKPNKSTGTGKLEVAGFKSEKLSSKVKKTEKPVMASRTAIVKMIKNSRAIFTVTFIDKDNEIRVMRAITRKNNIQTELGYLVVFSVDDKDFRSVNPQTITDFELKKVKYKVKDYTKKKTEEEN